MNDRRHWLSCTWLGRYWLGMFGLCLMALPPAGAAQAQADDYPNKAVAIISDAPPGSAADVASRFTADSLTKATGQQFIVINHAGAFGSFAARPAAEAAPDGYTLFMPS